MTDKISAFWRRLPVKLVDCECLGFQVMVLRTAGTRRGLWISTDRDGLDCGANPWPGRLGVYISLRFTRYVLSPRPQDLLYYDDRWWVLHPTGNEREVK